MKLSSPQKLKDIASIISAEFIGNAEHPVSGLNEIHMVEAGDIVFVDHQKYYDKALKSKATTILINKKVDCPEGKALLISEDPFRDYNKLVLHFHKQEYSTKNISESAKIGKGTIIMNGAVVGNNVSIGDNCVIHPNVTIYNNCIVGNNVIIHANTVIGADAFYYKKRPEYFDKMISCGRTVIHDDVEIGALCTIDRGVSGDTVIGQGTKLDNQIQIGHDTVIGKMCLIASGVGVAGVVVIEDNVTLWGQVGVRSDVRIGKGAVVLAQSGVGGNLEAGKTYFGSPAEEAKEKMKELVWIKRIPEIFANIKNK